MPTLNWLSRNEDLKSASQTDYCLLEEVPKFGVGDKDTGNMLIQGDNLQALKAILPFYAGQVKCIYIDPPYNTGSAFEHYDDNLEHTKWLSMMYPRLELLRELLAENGSIWISIDDDEGHYLKVICDEIFGRNNFVNTVIWQKKFSPQNDAKWLSDNHDLILVYAKNKEIWRPCLLPRSDEMDARYKNTDNDPRGAWTSSDLTVRTYVESCDYPITTPSGKIANPTKGRCWGVNKEKFQELVADNRIWFGKNGNNTPRIKTFLNEVQGGMVSVTVWLHSEVGHNQDAKKEVKTLFPENAFSTPKPERLLERIIALSTTLGDLVLDSFLGSGTTVAVAHKMGRHYIGIEMGEQAKTHCAVRLQKVIEGEQGGISKAVDWQGGGGFRFFTLGAPVFDSAGRINETINFAQLAAHIWFSETKTPWNMPTTNTTALGVYKSTAYALLYNGILHDRRVNGGNVLTGKTLEVIQYDLLGMNYEKLVIYGEYSRIGNVRLKTENIEFKQTPYDVKKK
ncbi:Modification methylase MboII [termite gut metagenome]|uniref:Modification methylase MboII n=1 Tax=termite gut metagenome TaxID=433724 RepID=A0A5J4RZL2_9ZZZZ